MKVNGKKYKTSFGLDLLEAVAEVENLEYVADVIRLFDISGAAFEKGLRLSDVKKLALLTHGAIKAAGQKPPEMKALKSWVLEDPIAALEVYGEFIKSLPNYEDKGEAEAVEKAAQVTP